MQTFETMTTRKSFSLKLRLAIVRESSNTLPLRRCQPCAVHVTPLWLTRIDQFLVLDWKRLCLEDFRLELADSLVILH